MGAGVGVGVGVREGTVRATDQTGLDWADWAGLAAGSWVLGGADRSDWTGLGLGRLGTNHRRHTGGGWGTQGV